jgi:hypothetical protein
MTSFPLTSLPDQHKKGYEILKSIKGDIQARAIEKSRHLMSVVTKNGSIIPKPEKYRKIIVYF